jgi:hypothetical protein
VQNGTGITWTYDDGLGTLTPAVAPAVGSITGLGTGVATALGINVGSAGAFVTFNGAGGTPSSLTLTNATGLPVSTGISGLGTGIATALAVNTGSAGAPVLFNGAGGTPSSLTLTNATGLPLGSITGFGTGVATALAINVGTAGAPVVNGGALGSPSSAGTMPAFTLGGTVTANGQSFSGTIANLGSVTTVDINGGTVDGAVIGGASAAAGSFTTLNASGLISANGGQIAFPASQAASADANTLDDYEEGTWTPTFTFVTPGNLSVTYSVRTGVYTKIGRLVAANWVVASSAFTHTTASGNASISGFPFTSANVASQNSYGLITPGGINKAGGYTDTFHALLANSSATNIFAGSPTGVANAFVTATDMPTGGTLSLSGACQYVV